MRVKLNVFGEQLDYIQDDPDIYRFVLNNMVKQVCNIVHERNDWKPTKEEVKEIFVEE